MNAKKMMRGCFVVACVSWALLPSVTQAQGSSEPLKNFVTFGGLWYDQTQPEAKFVEFRDVQKGGFVEKWMVSGEKGRRAWEFSGANALRADENARFNYTNGIRYELSANYVQTPHNFSFITRSPYDARNMGNGVWNFSLPDSFQAWNEQLLNVSGSAASAAGAKYNARIADLLRNSALMPIGFRTDAANAKLAMRPAKGWQVSLTGEKRDRSGTKPWSAAFGFSGAMEIWEPINQRTLDGGLGVTYTGKNVVVSADGGVSQFKNYASTILWDNPRRLTSSAAGNNAGAGYGQMDMYPDNKAVRGNLSIGLTLPSQTYATVVAGITQMTQDDLFLPFTTNQAVIDTAAKYPATPLAFLGGETSLGGKADATKLDAKLTTRAIQNLDATARMNYYKYDNKTPVLEYGSSVAYDQTLQKGPFETDPFGNHTMTIGADLDYDIMSQVTVGATAEHRKREHTYREVEKDAENVLIGTASLRPMKGVRLSGNYQTGKRTPDEPVNLDDFKSGSAYVEQPNLRRFDVSERKQTKAKGMLSWMANEKVDFSANYDYYKNDFNGYDAEKNNLVTAYGSQLGLLMNKGNNVVANMSLHATSAIDFSIGYGYGKSESDFHSKYSGAATLRQDDSLAWQIHTNDYNSLVLSSLDWASKSNKTTFSLNYEFDASRTAYDMMQAFDLVSGKVVPWTGSDVPTITYRRHDIQAQFMMTPVRDTQIGVRYGRQIFKAKDFSLDNIPVVYASSDAAVASTGIYLGDKLLNYKANTAALVVTRKF